MGGWGLGRGWGVEQRGRGGVGTPFEVHLLPMAAEVRVARAASGTRRESFMLVT